MKINTVTIEQAKADESIPRELIRQLDKLQQSDSTPLSRWARDSFRIARDLGFKHNRDDEIAELVITWAVDREYSQPQISRVLIDNGYRRREARGSYNTRFTPRNYIVTMKGMVRGLSGLTQVDIMTIQSHRELAERSKAAILKHVSRMGESDLREYPKQIGNLITVLKLVDAAIEEKKRGPKLTA